MNMKKKKQHYVWKHYLSQWAMDNKIWCLRYNNNDDRIFKSNLTNIGNINGFYQLEKLDENDIKLLKELFKNSHPLLQYLNNNWIKILSMVADISDLSDLVSKNAQKNNILLLELNKLRDALYNFGEDIHSKYEEEAIPLLDKLYQEDLSFLDTDDDYFFFTYFLCEQYFRTDAIKKSLMQLMQESFPSRIWNVLSRELATSMAFHIVQKKDIHKYVILKNLTYLNFITGDQPIINTFTELGNTKPLSDDQFELFYPLTPKLALLITKKDTYSHKTVNSISEPEVVKYYNDMIYKNSCEQIYGSKQQDLELYKGKNKKN